MSARSFIDTNVFVYTDDRDSPEKQATAIDLFARARQERWGVVSTQVLQEYFVAVTRKLGVSPHVARRKVEILSGLDVVRIDVADIIAAIDLHRLHDIGFWDALIVRAAKEAGASMILTEDLQHGRRLDGLEVVNPFL